MFYTFEKAKWVDCMDPYNGNCSVSEEWGPITVNVYQINNISTIPAVYNKENGEIAAPQRLRLVFISGGDLVVNTALSVEGMRGLLNDMIY